MPAAKKKIASKKPTAKRKKVVKKVATVKAKVPKGVVNKKPISTHAKKKGIIAKFSKHKKDTGSAQVQIALLTNKIKELTGHLKAHKKDNHSRRGLLLMVGKRRKLLNYIKMKKPEMYEKVIKTLDLRK
jgi:small subunit ribosomal protein S15